MKRFARRAATAALALILVILTAIPAAADDPQTTPAAADDPAQTTSSAIEDPAQAGGSSETETPAPAEQDRQYKKIGLFYGSSAKTSVSLTSETGLLLCREAESGYEILEDLGAGTAFTVEAAGSTVVLKDAAGSILKTDVSGLLLMPKGDFETRMIAINERRYRDAATFLASAGLLTVINYVELEHYLWGVLNAEMGAYYPLEALKAQAVAARSFTLCAGKHKSAGFDLCSTSDCQVYQGVAAERERSTQACTETEGVVMTYRDAIVPGYYMAYSGGYILNCEDVWGNYSGYLRGKRDEFTPEYNWQTQFTFDEIRTRLTSRGYDDPGNIRSIRIESRSPQGAVLAIIVEGDLQTVRFSRENVRTVLSLRSSQFSIGAQAYPEIIHGDGGAPKLWTSAGLIEAPETVCVLSADGGITELTTVGISALGANGEATELAAGGAGEITFTGDVVTGGAIYLNGLGWGHGLGLSQAGARVMAEQSYTYEQILNFYYTDIKLQNIHERQ